MKIEQRHTGETHSAGSVQAHPKRIRGKPAPLTENGRDACSTGRINGRDASAVIDRRYRTGGINGRDARSTNEAA